MSQSVTRRSMLKIGGAAALGSASSLPAVSAATPASARAIGLARPPREQLRFGVIGTGNRGSFLAKLLSRMDGADVIAIADNYAPAAEASAKLVQESAGTSPILYVKSDQDYLNMLDRPDLDAVVIATPWELHTPMAVAAMLRGKDAFVEIPAAITEEECWQLVETVEKTQIHCMMMENVCYGREELAVLNMCRNGVFGELLHGEAAYIHDLRFQMGEIDHGTGSWRTEHYTRRNGNLYPTHGLGPICQYMNINRGDRLDFMSSISSNARSRALYAAKEFPEGSIRRKQKFIWGDINTSIIRTVNGRTIMLQWDEQLPRPRSRHNFIQGTLGAWGGFPNRLAVEGLTPDTQKWVEGKELLPWLDRYEHPLWKEQKKEAQAAGGHGGMDFLMMWRIVYCLRNGLPLDQDVYDAATWSVIGPLSERSVAQRGRSIDIPDFTRGHWADRAAAAEL